MHSWNTLFPEVKANILSYVDCDDLNSFALTSKEGADFSFQELLNRISANLNAFLKKHNLMQSDQRTLLAGEWVQVQPDLPEPSPNAKLQMWSMLTDFLADSFPDVARKSEFAEWLALESTQSINHEWFWQIAMYKFLLNMGIQLEGDERNKPLITSDNLVVAKALVLKSTQWFPFRFYAYKGPYFLLERDTSPALHEILHQFKNELHLSGFKRLAEQFHKRCQVTFHSGLSENEEVVRQAIAERDKAIANFAQHDFLLEPYGRYLYFDDIRAARVFYKILGNLNAQSIAFLKQVLRIRDSFRHEEDFADYQPSRLISLFIAFSQTLYSQYLTELFKNDNQNKIRIAIFRRILLNFHNDESPLRNQASSYRFLGDRLQNVLEKALVLYRLFPSHSLLLHAGVLFYLLGRDHPLGKLFKRARQFLVVMRQMQLQSADNYLVIERYIQDYLNNIIVNDSYISSLYHDGEGNLNFLIEEVGSLWSIDAEKFNRYLALAREKNMVESLFKVFRYWPTPYQQEQLASQEQMQAIVRSDLFEQLMINFLSRETFLIVGTENFCKLIRPSSALWQLPVKTVLDLFKPAKIETQLVRNREKLLGEIAKLEKKQFLYRWQRLGPHVLVLNDLCYSVRPYSELRWLSLLLSKFTDTSFEQLYRHIAHLLPTAKKINKKPLKEALAIALSAGNLPAHIATCLLFDCTSASVHHYWFIDELMKEISIDKLDQLTGIIIFKDESAAWEERNLCYLLYSVMYYPPSSTSLQRTGLTTRDMVRFIVQHAGDEHFIAFLRSLYLDAAHSHRWDINKETLLAYCHANQSKRSRDVAIGEERETKRARRDVRLFAQPQVPAVPPVLPPQQQDEAMDLDDVAPLPRPPGNI